jgi:hypothetical protein
MDMNGQLPVITDYVQQKINQIPVG